MKIRDRFSFLKVIMMLLVVFFATGLIIYDQNSKNNIPGRFKIKIPHGQTFVQGFIEENGSLTIITRDSTDNSQEHEFKNAVILEHD